MSTTSGRSLRGAISDAAYRLVTASLHGRSASFTGCCSGARASLPGPSVNVALPTNVRTKAPARGRQMRPATGNAQCETTSIVARLAKMESSELRSPWFHVGEGVPPMPLAARITDMHTCPKVEPGPVPHVGGPTVSGEPTVLIGFMPAARVGDTLVCVGPPDSIKAGEPSVIIGNKD